MKAVLKRFIKDERGLETIEYAVMTALIVAAVIGAITAVTAAIQGRFEDVEDTILAIPSGQAPV